MWRCAKAFAHVHAKCYIHFDVKPENFLYKGFRDEETPFEIRGGHFVQLGPITRI
jgi:serine/threonine protein kinase